MFNPFKSLGNLKKLRDQAKAMQAALAREEVVVERDGVKIVMSGDQKVKQVIIDNQEENRVARAVEEAIKRTQQLAASKLSQMSGMFGS